MNSHDEIPELALLGLQSEDLKIILDILQRYLPGREVWAFGSRVSGKARPFSDLDLVIHSDQPIDSHQLHETMEAFRNSYLPIKVDLIDWAKTSDEFQKIIQAQHIVLVPTARAP